MALQKSITIGDSSLTVNNAYIKIHRIEFYKDQSVILNVTYFANKSDRDDNKTPIISLKQFSLNAQSADFDTFFSTSVLDELNNNIIKSSYNYLKTLAEFSGATDV